MGRKKSIEIKEHKAVYLKPSEYKIVEKKAGKALMSPSSFMRKTLCDALEINIEQ